MRTGNHIINQLIIVKAEGQNTYYNSTAYVYEWVSELERLVPEMIYYVSRGMLNSTYSLTHSLTHS